MSSKPICMLKLTERVWGDSKAGEWSGEVCKQHKCMRCYQFFISFFFNKFFTNKNSYKIADRNFVVSIYFLLVACAPSIHQKNLKSTHLLLWRRKTNKIWNKLCDNHFAATWISHFIFLLTSSLALSFFLYFLFSYVCLFINIIF